jgi:hypothetical protein
MIASKYVIRRVCFCVSDQIENRNTPVLIEPGCSCSINKNIVLCDADCAEVGGGGLLVEGGDLRADELIEGADLLVDFFG